MGNANSLEQAESWMNVLVRGSIGLGLRRQGTPVEEVGLLSMNELGVRSTEGWNRLQICSGKCAFGICVGGKESICACGCNSIRGKRLRLV